MRHERTVWAVAFGLDGKLVASGSLDRTVRVWRWQPRDLIATATTFLPRNLTRAEWKPYIGDALPYQAVCPGLPVEPEATETASP